MKLTAMQQMILAGVAMLIAVVVVIALLIVPMFGQLADLDTQAQAAQTSRQQAQALLGQLQQAKQHAAETQAELLKIGTEIPDSPQMPTLIIELQNMGDASGVTITRMSPTEPSTVVGANYSEIVMETRIEGTWADLLDYMRRLNKTTRLLRVTEFSIAPITQTTTVEETTTVTTVAQRVSATLKMKAYVSNASATSGGVGSSAAPASGSTGSAL